jgi:hypothetical protein
MWTVTHLHLTYFHCLLSTGNIWRVLIWLITERAGVAVTLMTRIREIIDSNLVWDTGNPGGAFSWFSWVPPCRIRDSIPILPDPFQFIFLTTMSQDNVVGIATGCRLDSGGVGVRVPVGARVFSSARRPDRFWGPPNLLSSVYGTSFPGGKSAGAWSWPFTSN